MVVVGRVRVHAHVHVLPVALEAVAEPVDIAAVAAAARSVAVDIAHSEHLDIEHFLDSVRLAFVGIEHLELLLGVDIVADIARFHPDYIVSEEKKKQYNNLRGRVGIMMLRHTFT